jgi:hypothetical protein
MCLEINLPPILAAIEGLHELQEVTPPPYAEFEHRRHLGISPCRAEGAENSPCRREPPSLGTQPAAEDPWVRIPMPSAPF